MKPKTIILMVVAVVCGLGASYMTSQLLQKDDSPPEAPPIEKVTLLVAKKSLDIHTALRAKPEDFFQEKSFVKEDAPKEAFVPADMAKLKGKYLKRPLRKNDHVTPDDLLDTVVSLRTLAPGMRAVGIPVKAYEIAGGFASLPGSHVDIVWTTRAGGGDTFSRVLLEDVVVLAADTDDNQAGGGGARMASVVTVALLPEDAMKVALAMENGSLRLVLRNLDDSTGSQKRMVSLKDVIADNVTHGVEKAPEPPQPAPPVVLGPDPNEIKRDDTSRSDRPAPPKLSQGVEPKDTDQPKLTKVMHIVTNGNNIRYEYHFEDEAGNVISAPHGEQPQEPTPAPKTKKDQD